MSALPITHKFWVMFFTLNFKCFSIFKYLDIFWIIYFPNLILVYSENACVISILLNAFWFISGPITQSQYFMYTWKENFGVECSIDTRFICLKDLFKTSVSYWFHVYLFSNSRESWEGSRNNDWFLYFSLNSWCLFSGYYWSAWTFRTSESSWWINPFNIVKYVIFLWQYILFLN